MKIYFGINGNQWAFDGRAWASIYDFEYTQRRWGIAVVICLCMALHLILLGEILMVTIGSLFAGLH